MGHTATINTNSYHLNINTDMVAKDPIRALKKGSMVKLNFSELMEMYWKPGLIYVQIPYVLESNSFEKKLQLPLKLPPKHITFLLLEDLSNPNVVHGWMSAVYSDDRVDMAKGWFNYDMLIRCIDFSAVDDS